MSTAYCVTEAVVDRLEMVVSGAMPKIGQQSAHHQRDQRGMKRVVRSRSASQTFATCTSASNSAAPFSFHAAIAVAISALSKIALCSNVI